MLFIYLNKIDHTFSNEFSSLVILIYIIIVRSNMYTYVGFTMNGHKKLTHVGSNIQLTITRVLFVVFSQIYTFQLSTIKHKRTREW